MTFAHKCIYAALMAFAMFIIIGGKFPAFGRLFIAEGPTDRIPADLYLLSALERFREEIPVKRQAPEGTLDEAEVLTLGDSFFNSALESDLFAIELAARTGRNVFNLQSTGFFEPQSYPLSFLEGIGYKGGKRRIMILESVERSVFERGERYNRAAGGSGNDLDALAFKVLKNNDVEYFFKNNVIVHPVVKWLKNVRFEYFKIVDGSIGSYSENPRMLFYNRDIAFRDLRKTDAMMDATADSIARLSQSLKERYDIELIYVIIPNKYSVYHGLVNDGYSYDEFIPRLSKKLSDRGVRNIDIYSVYSRYNKQGMPQLYYSSDTHYTPLGKALLVNECARVIGTVLQNN